AAERGAAATAETLQDVSSRYARWAVGLMEEEGANPLLALRSPSGGDEQSGGGIVSMVSLIMAGMMVFYTFFTGAASAQSILQEEEEGTLARLFTTPTPRSAILGGKFISIFAVLVVQVLALLVVSAFLFGIDWGAPLPVILVALGLIVVAASFGIFVTSLLKDTRQVGIVYGGVMTVAGMLGMSSVFTGGASGPMDTVSLVVPQGWCVRAWRLLLEGGGLRDVLSTVVVMLAMGVGFFLFGVFKFRKRFA
ncbi:MAG: ABC transporter permease, partial [Chloroflexota bacterium]|nr:ABC transporter permease [Chloroflexota bacterium]